MDPIAIATLGIIGMFVLIMLHFPIGIAMAIGIIPFFFADLTRLGIIAVFPVLALWLPDKLGMLLG